MARKILYSSGYGAGWSTWMHRIPTKFACEYPPIIEALEKGETLNDAHPAVLQFVKDASEQFDEEPYLGGIEDLRFMEIDDNDKYQISEYDGSESVKVKSAQDWN